MKVTLLGLLLLMAGLGVFAQSPGTLKLNQIQIIGSHNSYKKLPDPRVMKFLMKMRKTLGRKLDPIGIDYGHLPIDSQFSDYNVRGLEIDIYNDPKGGLYYKRKVNSFVHGMHAKSHIEALKKPGFKVLHIKDVDYQTNYYTFKEVLVALKQWSDAHPSHLPIFINLETKTKGPGDYKKLLHFLGFSKCVLFDAAACDSIDAEIKSVFGNDLKNVLTPDMLKGKYNSLDEMASNNGWPTLDACRGKVAFIMLGGAKATYLENHAGGVGRAMCVYSHPGRPECAFIMQDDPVANALQIPELVKKGYIVRTRSDEETVQSRNNDSTHRDAAFISGAQIISTDYYKPDLRFSKFTVQWEGGHHVGRLNPILFPKKTEWLTEP